MAYDVETMVNRHIVSNLGARLLSELTIEDVGYLTGVLRQCPGIRGATMGPRRANKILKVLKRALQSAVEMGLLIQSPMAGWRALRVPISDMRTFPIDEFKALLKALPAVWRPYFEFSVWTGLRPGEQAGLQWSDVE